MAPSIRRASLWILLGSVAALAAVSSLGGEGGGPRAPASPSSTGLSRSPRAVTAPAAVERGPEAADEAEVREAPPRPVGPRDEERPERRSRPGSVLVLLAVDAASDAPLPGTEILHGPGVARPPAEELELEERLRRTGVATVTDAAGRVEVPVGAGPIELVARREGLYAELRVDPRAEDLTQPRTLRLAPDWNLRVITFDEDGGRAPAVEVGLRLGTVGRPLGVTGGDGSLVVRHAQAALGPGDPSLQPMLFVRRPGAEHAGVRLDPLHPPDEAVRLVVPATGHVVARVWDASGAPRPALAVALSTVEGESTGQAGTRIRAEPYVRRTDEKGEAVFEHVTAGRSYKIRALAETQHEEAETPGPVARGGTTVVELFLEEAPVTLLGRALDERGAPLAGERLRLSGPPVDPSSLLATTDAGGSFAFELDASATGADLAALELTWLEEGRMTPVGAPLPAGEVQPGVNFVGDLRLEATPVLVAGRVLGAAPDLHDVRLVVETLAPGANPTEGWRPVLDVALFPRGDGAFELRGAAPDGPSRLRVSGPRHAPREPVEFEPGARDLRVVLLAGGTLRASVRSPRPVRARLVPVEVAGPAGTPFVVDLPAGTPDEPSERVWYGLAAGTYDLFLEDPADGAVLAEVRGLAVERGRACADPRLGAIEVP